MQPLSDLVAFRVILQAVHIPFTEQGGPIGATLIMVPDRQVMDRDAYLTFDENGKLVGMYGWIGTGPDLEKPSPSMGFHPGVGGEEVRPDFPQETDLSELEEMLRLAGCPAMLNRWDGHVRTGYVLAYRDYQGHPVTFWFDDLGTLTGVRVFGPHDTWIPAW